MYIPQGFTLTELKNYLHKYLGIEAFTRLKLKTGNIELLEGKTINNLKITLDTTINEILTAINSPSISLRLIPDTAPLTGIPAVESLVEKANFIKGSNWKKFYKIFKGKSDNQIISLVDKFNRFIDQQFTEEFHIDLVKERWKRIFMEKFSERIPRIKESVLEAYWNKNYENKIKNSEIGTVNKLLRRSYETAVLNLLLVFASSERSSKVFNKLNTLLDRLPTDVKARDFIRASFIQESFALLFDSSNVKATQIKSYFGGNQGFRFGARKELHVFLNHLPVKIMQFYEDNDIDPKEITSLDPLTRYDYSENRKILMNDPFIGFSPDNERFPDLGVWRYYYEDPISGERVETVLITPVKYSSNYQRANNRETLIDGLSSVYVAVLDNLHSRSPAKHLKYELEILNTRHNALKEFDTFFGNDVMDILFGWTRKGKIDFLTCSPTLDLYGIKVSKNAVREEVIIKELNDKIWGSNELLQKDRYKNPQLSDKAFRSELTRLAKDRSFIFDNIIKNKNYGDLFKSKTGRWSQAKALKIIQTFISSLTQKGLSTWKINRHDTNDLITVKGLMRSTSMNSYFISDKKLEGLSLDQLRDLFDKVFVIEENGQLSDGAIEGSWQPNRAFRIIHKIEKGVKKFALIEVSQNPDNKVENPSGWSDGVIVSDSKTKKDIVFRNAMFTDHYGHLLSSQFFDVDKAQFSFKQLKEFKKKYEKYILTDEYGKKYGIKLLHVISTTDSNNHLNMLVELSITNPNFVSESLDTHYSMDVIEDVLYNFDVGKRMGKKWLELQEYSLLSVKTLKDFGLITTQDEALNVYFNLFARKPGTYRHLDQYILGLLGKLNTRYYPETGYIDPESSRDQEDIEEVVTELFKNTPDSEKSKFCFKTTEMVIRSKDYSLKDWMSDLYGRIIAYSGENELILNAKFKLIDIANQFGELDTSKTKFIGSEINAGIEMFEVLQGLFGHVTIRFILLGMFNVYDGPADLNGEKSIKIAINTRPTWITIRKMINRFQMISSAQSNQYFSIHSNFEEQIGPEILYSLLFSNSFLYLPIDGLNHLSKNGVFFGYSSIELSGQNINTENIGGIFAEQYEIFENAQLTPQGRLDKVCEYRLSLAEIVGKRAEKQIMAGFLPDGVVFTSDAQRDDYISTIKKYIKLLIFDSSGAGGRFVQKLEGLIDGLYYSGVSVGNKIRIPLTTSDNLYVVRMTKDDLAGMNIKSLGTVISFFGSINKDDIINHLYMTTGDNMWTTNGRKIIEDYIQDFF